VDTSCAGTNWALLELTGEVCKVAPFLDSYQPMNEILLARCGTVWTDPLTYQEYLLVGDQMLWFGSLFSHLLINPKQISANGIPVFDDPFDSTSNFGIESKQPFCPFQHNVDNNAFQVKNTKIKHLPVILLTSETWNPSKEIMRYNLHSQEAIEMCAIKSLMTGTTGISKEQTDSNSIRSTYCGETNLILGQIASVYYPRDFCEQLIFAVSIATVYHDDVVEWEEQRTVSGIITYERHSKEHPKRLPGNGTLAYKLQRTQYGLPCNEGYIWQYIQ
jgi:hypothetical protein